MTRVPSALAACAVRMRCPLHGDSCAGDEPTADPTADPAERARLAVVEGEGLGCAAGHRFDVARQGYVNLLTGPAPAAADTPAMVGARERLLGAGVQAELAARLVGAVRAGARHLDVSSLDAPRRGASAPDTAPPDTAPPDTAPPDTAEPLLLDLGAGTGHHTARVLDSRPDLLGLAVDLSRPAAQRAARAHDRLAAVVADVWRQVPVVDATVSVALSVFAPRPPHELARVIRPGGVLVVAMPAPGHLAPLVDTLGLLQVGEGKLDRLDTDLADAFDRTAIDHLDVEVALDHDLVRATALMGPSAHHLDPDTLDRDIARLPDTVAVRQHVELVTYRRR